MENEEYEKAFGEDLKMTPEQKKEKFIDKLAIICALLLIFLSVMFLITCF
jgi:hypothetical protein